MVSSWFTTFDDAHATPAWSAISGDSVPFPCHFFPSARQLVRQDGGKQPEFAMPDLSRVSRLAANWRALGKSH